MKIVVNFYYLFNYILNNKKECQLCNNISEIGGNYCQEYDNDNGIYKCTEFTDDSIFVENKCIFDQNLGRCFTGSIIETKENSVYICTKCKTSVIYDYNGIYTHIKDSNGISKCIEPKGILKDCEIGTQDINGNYNCIKYYSYYPFIYSDTKLQLWLF